MHQKLRKTCGAALVQFDAHNNCLVVLVSSMQVLCTCIDHPFCALQGSHASWKVLECPGFFLENSRTWKVLENHFGPGKSWKLKLKVLESPGKISLKVLHFSSGSNGKQAAIV